MNVISGENCGSFLERCGNPNDHAIPTKVIPYHAASLKDIIFITFKNLIIEQGI